MKQTRKKSSALVREFKTLLPFFTRYRGRYLAGLVCLVVVDAAQVLIPQWTRQAINMIQTEGFQWREVFYLCLAMTGTMFVIGWGRFLWRYFIHGASRHIEAELREKLFAHLLTLNGDFYEKNKTGDLMARSSNDIGAVRMAMGWGIVGGIDGTVMAAAILVIIFFQAPQVAVFAVLPIPVITVLIVFFGKAVGKRFKRAQEAYSAMSEAVQETFAGMRVIKSFVREETFIGKFAHTNDRYVDANMSVVRVYGLFFPLILFLAGLTTLIVLYVGGKRTALGLMRLGDLVALTAYIQMLVWPMFGAGFTVNMIQRGAVSMKRINEVLNTAPTIRSPVVTCPVQASKTVMTTESPAAIEIRGLNLVYADGKTALRDINLSVREGMWLGILGRTGAGKSSLIKLLPRLLEAPEGSVFIKGRSIRDWPLEELRALFGVAPQDGFLFSDSIRNNIAYGAAAGDPVDEFIQLASLEKDITGFNDGISTVIGERGLSLSGGQKQRVTIARALMRDPEILILDDALSACDTETERAILTNLEKKRRGKTTIIIAHRVSAFRLTDAVAVLEDGCLAAYGSPAELLTQKDGYYARTARLQQLDRQAGEFVKKQ